MKRKEIKLTPVQHAQCHFSRPDPLDEFFYGDFQKYVRHEQEKLVYVTTNYGIIVPVEDWQYGKRLNGGQIRALAEHFYAKGLEDMERIKEYEAQKEK